MVKMLASTTDPAAMVREELEAAGLTASGSLSVTVTDNGDREERRVSDAVVGDWTLIRFWSYWVAESTAGVPLPLPPGIGGGSVRADGHCSPSHRPTGRVHTFHIDDVAGLRRFASFARGSS